MTKRIPPPSEAPESESGLNSLATIWPDGVHALVAELKREGFSVHLSGESAAALSLVWPQLKKPVSAESAGQSDSYAYVSLENSKHNEAASAHRGLTFLHEESPLRAEMFSQRILRVSHPDAALDYVLSRVCPPEWCGASAPVPEGVIAEPGVHIGPDCMLGRGSILESGVRLGRNVRVGENTRIGSNSRIADHSVIGAHCIFTGNVSIGGPGFGFVQYPGEKTRRPRRHVGRVLVGDFVRMGAFVGIDRGVFEDTVIGSGTAIDNLVQIAHNCTVGEHGTICALVGLSGSTTVGARFTIAGLSGTKGHVTIGNDVTVAAQSGINRDISDGEIVKGYPPRKLSQALQLQALIGKLPDIYERLKGLEKREK